jgi:CRP-like cAMP-binding protein
MWDAEGGTMLELDDLRATKLLGDFSDQHLDIIKKISLKKEYRTGDIIFAEGDYAGYLYAVHDGKVSLEIEKNNEIKIAIGTIARGAAFGFSALVDTEDKRYTTSAKALTDVHLIAWRAADLEELFYSDFELGFKFMKRIAAIAKKRLQIRNVQFLDIYS